MRYTTGNLLDADAEALVNTVNTVGVMGKGIALMFKERFPENFRLYEKACREGRLDVGHVLATETGDMYGPRWIINFPTKKHWRNPSKLDWIREGLHDLRMFVLEKGVRSVALPPLGAGNGGLHWPDVRQLIETELEPLTGVDVLVFEPTARYQNVSKRAGVEALTPARALVAEIIRRYWILGIECTLLEVQKLAWFLTTETTRLGLADPFRLDFQPNRYGPYADGLRHLLNAMDGSYLQCDKRISDAGPFDVIHFNDARRGQVELYFTTPDAKPYRAALDAATDLIDGFESPLGMELLATVDWLMRRQAVEGTRDAIQSGIAAWNGGGEAARRKQRIFEPRLIDLALERLTAARSNTTQPASPN